MNISTIEQAIIEKLKADVHGVAVEAYPDKPALYKLTHAKGALLVRYAGSDYSESEVIGYVSQERTMTFDIDVVMRHLTGHSGIYEYLDAVNKALTGFRPYESCDKMQPVSDGFVSEDNGIWIYTMAFKTKTVNSE